MSSKDTRAVAEAERQKAKVLQDQAQDILTTARQQADQNMQQADEHLRQADRADTNASQEEQQERDAAIKKAEEEGKDKGVIGALF